MRRLLFLVCCFVGWTVLAANPILVLPIRALWFTESGQAIVQADLHMEIEEFYQNTFCSGEVSGSIPSGTIWNADHSFNLSELIPGLNLNPQSGNLSISTNYMETIYISWGDGAEVDLRPFQPGQAAMIVEGNYCSPTFYQWIKLGSPPSLTYEPTESVSYYITCTYASGHPAPGVPVYGYWWDSPSGYTDTEGHFLLQRYAAKSWLRVKDNLTGEFIFDQVYYPEPGQQNQIELGVSGSSNLELVNPDILRIYPTVLRLTESSLLRFDYDSVTDSDHRIEIYDLRGRQIFSSPSVVSELDLKSYAQGVYFINLLHRNRVVATKKLIILN